MIQIPKISIGMIVLNGEPFLRYNLKSLYPFAHEIIVVEGASYGATSIASPEGHSIDNTLQVLLDFKREEDPDEKIKIIIAEDDGHPNGFWPGEKDQQSQAYASRATGDYLWQVDVDEFYRKKDIQAILTLLREEPEISAMSFRMITFWGGFDYITDGWYLRQGANQYHRLFKWGPGYEYITHRPPTVIDECGNDLRKLCWIPALDTVKKGIFLYHYSLVFPKQVKEKSEYYKNAQWAKRERALIWARNSFETLEQPFRVHNVYKYPSWIEKFQGTHPAQIEALQGDINDGQLSVKLRCTEDIEKILSSFPYILGRTILKIIVPVHLLWYRLKGILSMLKQSLNLR